jgi:NAD-dependent deacetylase
MLFPEDLLRIGRFLQESRGHRLVFLAVGTSGVVYPAAGMVQQARAAGAEAWLVNVEEPDNARSFDHFVRGPSAIVLPALLSR